MNSAILPALSSTTSFYTFDDCETKIGEIISWWPRGSGALEVASQRGELKKLGGLHEVREDETKVSKRRKTRNTGGPTQLHEALKGVEGSFTVDKAMAAAKKADLSFSRTDTMNYLQTLIKNGAVKIIESGRGRHVAVYELKKARKNAVEKVTTNTE